MLVAWLFTIWLPRSEIARSDLVGLAPHDIVGES